MGKTAEQLRKWSDTIIRDSLFAAGQTYILKIVDNHFKPGNQQAYNWAPLDLDYAAEKQRRHPGRPMLVATGALQQSTKTGDVKVDPNTGKMTITFRLPEYGALHHTGAGRLPKRSPVEPNERDAGQMRDAMQEEIDTQAARLNRMR